MYYILQMYEDTRSPEIYKNLAPASQGKNSISTTKNKRLILSRYLLWEYKKTHKYTVCVCVCVCVCLHL
jgi:hypothetical protein